MNLNRVQDSVQHLYVVSSVLYLQDLQRKTIAPPQKGMNKASIFLNDLLKAAARFNKPIPKHKID